MSYEESSFQEHAKLDAEKFSGFGPSATDRTQLRCQPLREAYYKCTLNSHVDDIRDNCQSWWWDYRECLFEKKMMKKMDEVMRIKEERLKAVGFKRPFWGGPKADILFDYHPRASNIGKPIDPDHEHPGKVNVSL